MKKVIGNIASFILGATVFVAGGAIANEQTVEQVQTPVATTESTEPQQPAVQDQQPFTESPAPQDPVEETGSTIQWLVTSDNPVFCWNIGKTNELDRDCFCVEDSVTNMDEVECLIESGVVPEDTREIYREQIELNN